MNELTVVVFKHHSKLLPRMGRLRLMVNIILGRLRTELRWENCWADLRTCWRAILGYTSKNHHIKCGVLGLCIFVSKQSHDAMLWDPLLLYAIRGFAIMLCHATLCYVLRLTIQCTNRFVPAPKLQSWLVIVDSGRPFRFWGIEIRNLNGSRFYATKWSHQLCKTSMTKGLILLWTAEDGRPFPTADDCHWFVGCWVTISAHGLILARNFARNSHLLLFWR